MGKILRRGKTFVVEMTPVDLLNLDITIAPGPWMFGQVVARAAYEKVREKFPEAKVDQFRTHAVEDKFIVEIIP